ncbi:MAG: MFS transporter [Candidatus Dormibacteraeota bacterium]|nr:MFS transporter [Candidatus Dormibacteraeota bacterium]MBO0761927.1 MFS transporter [Candidatus Dormibacteraeota bacterium]
MDRKWWTLAAVCAGVFMLLLDVTIVNVALPDIEHGFGAGLSDLQWVLDAYALTLAALLLTAGSLADLWGRRRVFATGIVLFTLGSLLCGLSTSSLFLILARGFQGIGGAIMFATALALLANAFRGPERGIAFGVFGAITGVALAIGPVLGGVIIAALDWRWIFFVNVPIGLAALAVTLAFVEESFDPAARRPDWPGLATFSAALAGLVVGLIRSTSEGWGSTTVIACFVAAALLLGAFVVIELRQRTPMLDLSLFRVPAFVGGLVAAFAVSASVIAVVTYIVLYFQDILGFSPLQAGLRFLVFTGVIFVVAAVAGRLSSRVPARYLIGSGFVLVAAGLFLMAGLDASSGWTHFVPGFAVAGVGVGLINVPLASVAVGVVEPRRAGMASGINSTLRQVGIATGVAALGSIFAARNRDQVSATLASSHLGAAGDRVAGSLSGAPGQPGALQQLPLPVREVVEHALRVGFTSGLNEILLISAGLALAAAILSLVLIRSRDMAAQVDRPAETDAELAA